AVVAVVCKTRRGEIGGVRAREGDSGAAAEDGAGVFAADEPDGLGNRTKNTGSGCARRAPSHTVREERDDARANTEFPAGSECMRCRRRAGTCAEAGAARGWAAESFYIARA